MHQSREHRIKVALVGPYPVNPPHIRGGGVEAAEFYLAEGLRADDAIDLHVVVPTKDVDEKKQIQYQNVLLHYIPIPRKRIVPNMISMIRSLGNAIDEISPDIVHSHHSSGTIAAVRRGYPVVHTIHAVAHREARYLSGSLGVRLNQALFIRLAHKAISQASHLTAVSTYVAREYAPIARAGITVVPNALEDRFFGIPDKTVEDRLLYAGYIGPRKNVLGLVRAFDLIKRARPEARLVIAGGVNDPAYMQSIQEYVDKHDLGDSIEFLGLLRQDEIEREYARAAVVCIMSWHETFSLTVSQGMAAGKPVVTTDSGGPSDLVIDGETGFLVANGDERMFAERVIELLSDADVRRRVGQNAKEVAWARFRKEIVASQTIDVYKRVLRMQDIVNRDVLSE